ncbi:MAG TPA: aldo/keto reductase, partial [Pyrinomonadaceae bacterium]|nr:aldo/keto reductase [Pyrinomonadaceae bacterium]
YLHNPETQLGVVSRAEFETRLRAAFEQLERSVAEGKIKTYGAATWNGFRVAPNSRSYHSLERMVELARDVAGDAHHFRFIQLPFNLGMPEALTIPNQTFQGAQVSVLEAARALEVTVVASASILQGKVARDLTPEIREPLGSLATDALTAIQFVRSTPGITTALVGMSRREHVEENLRLARIEPARPDDYQQLFSAGGE